MATKVIVFGPTGAVGSAAALEAHRRGAEVVLAMRDTTKPTPKLPELPRIQADLSDPVSVKKAVQQSGAKAAFCYIAHGQDMYPTFQAMQDGGIDYVVLLSSWTVYPNIDAAAASDDLIGKMHATAELNLRSLGLKHTALRPAWFASNMFHHHPEEVKTGQVYLYKPEKVFDWLAPEDIGLIAGVKLLGDPEIVPIAGPELLTQRQAFNILSEELKRDFNIIEIDDQEYTKTSPLPLLLTQSLVNCLRQPHDTAYPVDLYQKGSGSVKKYTGKEQTKFRDFVRLTIQRSGQS